MSDIQEVVARIAEELVASGAERGLQVAGYVDQQAVVDVVAGVTDPVSGRPVEPGTLFYNWSIGKGATATLVHRLVDAGAIGYDTPVAEFWPEFARHGKQAITVRQVLNHSAGVPGLPAGATLESVCSWESMTRALEDAELWWEPSTQVGYHAYTFGYLAGAARGGVCGIVVRTRPGLRQRQQVGPRFRARPPVGRGRLAPGVRHGRRGWELGRGGPRARGRRRHHQERAEHGLRDGAADRRRDPCEGRPRLRAACHA